MKPCKRCNSEYTAVRHLWGGRNQDRHGNITSLDYVRIQVCDECGLYQNTLAHGKFPLYQEAK